MLNCYWLKNKTKQQQDKDNHKYYVSMSWAALHTQLKKIFMPMSEGNQIAFKGLLYLDGRNSQKFLHQTQAYF